MSDWKGYRRTAVAEMRPYRTGDSLEGVSVSAPDWKMLDEIDLHSTVRAEVGFIARNPVNHADQWYVAQAYAEANFDLANPITLAAEKGGRP